MNLLDLCDRRMGRQMIKQTGDMSKWVSRQIGREMVYTLGNWIDR